MMKSKRQQQGFSLFMVMIMMVVIALLVVVTSQTTSTESRLSTNEADRKYAFSLAEEGLLEGENKIQEWHKKIVTDKETVKQTFTEACTGGLCAPVERISWVVDADKQNNFIISDAENGHSQVAAWKRANVFSSSKTSFEATSKDSSNKKTRYIIEYLGQRNVEGMINDYFRVTSHSQGQNAQTEVTLQSYVEMTRNP